MGEEANLDLNKIDLENAVTGATRIIDVWKDCVFPALSVVAFLLLIASIYFLLKKRSSRVVPASLMIEHWPRALKLCLFPLVFSFALTHIFAAASVYFNTRIANPSNSEYFFNMGVGRLFSLTHAHLFAHATMYFVLAVLVQFTGRKRLFTEWAPLLALWAGIFDVISWWGMKELSANFEILSALTGSSFTLAFVLMAYAILSAAVSTKGK